MVKWSINTLIGIQTDIQFSKDSYYFFLYRIHKDYFVISSLGRGMRIEQKYAKL
jgi:hypothetical protein